MRKDTAEAELEVGSSCPTFRLAPVPQAASRCSLVAKVKIKRAHDGMAASHGVVTSKAVIFYFAVCLVGFSLKRFDELDGILASGL